MLVFIIILLILVEIFLRILTKTRTKEALKSNLAIMGQKMTIFLIQFIGDRLQATLKLSQFEGLKIFTGMSHYIQVLSTENMSLVKVYQVIEMIFRVMGLMMHTLEQIRVWVRLERAYQHTLFVLLMRKEDIQVFPIKLRNELIVFD
jgi:hypothetical protein